MKKNLLFVNGCIRGRDSRTLRLAQRVVSRIPDADIDVLLLPALHLTPYGAAEIAERDALSRAGAFDAPFFALANQFKNADAVVLSFLGPELSRHGARLSGTLVRDRPDLPL